MRLERIAWVGSERPEESALRAILAEEGFDALRWDDPPGASYAPHAHDRDESLWVLAGDITFGVDGAALRLEAGDRLMLPAGTVHTALTGPRGASYLIGQHLTPTTTPTRSDRPSSLTRARPADRRR